MKSLNSFENGFSEKLRCDMDHLCGADGKKIFICHSSDDKLYADLIEKFLEKIGFKNIFYSSSSNSRGIFPSEDIYERLINELNYGKLHTIFLLSNSFYNSPTSIAEIGAVWIKSKQIYDIQKSIAGNMCDIFCVPEFDVNDIQPPLNTNQHIVRWSEQDMMVWKKSSTLFSYLEISDGCWTEAVKSFISDYNKIKKERVGCSITGKLFSCNKLKSSEITALFTTAKTDIFICGTNLIWLTESEELLSELKTVLKNNNLRLYLMMMSPFNEEFLRSYIINKSVSYDQKRDYILSSLSSLLHFIDENNEISKRISLKLISNTFLTTGGICKDLNLFNRADGDESTEIYATTYLNNVGPGNSPIIKITQKYAGEAFATYRRYFTSLWETESAISWSDLKEMLDRISEGNKQVYV